MVESETGHSEIMVLARSGEACFPLKLQTVLEQLKGELCLGTWCSQGVVALGGQG